MVPRYPVLPSLYVRYRDGFDMESHRDGLCLSGRRVSAVCTCDIIYYVAHVSVHVSGVVVVVYIYSHVPQADTLGFTSKKMFSKYKPRTASVFFMLVLLPLVTQLHENSNHTHAMATQPPATTHVRECVSPFAGGQNSPCLAPCLHQRPLPQNPPHRRRTCSQSLLHNDWRYTPYSTCP